MPKETGIKLERPQSSASTEFLLYMDSVKTAKANPKPPFKGSRVSGNCKEYRSGVTVLLLILHSHYSEEEVDNRTGKRESGDVNLGH